MSYNEKLPMDDEYIASGPADIRENFRALKEDRIVDAGILAGLTPGNAGGNIPISNGNLNANLNAERVGGKLAADFANVSHTHAVATGSSNGFLANTDKTKLDTIATGAEVNQNAFSNVLVGSTTIQADSKTDTLEIVAGANITLTPDATNDRVTIAVNGTLPIANGGTGAATPAEALANLGIAATVTELNYLDGVTDNVQTQLNAKPPISHASIDTTYGVANAINYGHVMASSVTPLANGIATVGTDNGKFAREGHVHPTDTTRASLASPDFSGTPTAPTAAAGTNTNQLATTAFVNAAILQSGNVPPGGSAVPFTGTFSGVNPIDKFTGKVRADWQMCDGTNGTIDLRDRFILAAGTTYSAGTTGGEATHTLTINEMPKHSHSYTNSGDSRAASGSSPSGNGIYSVTDTTGMTGGGAAHNNMPPYYALAYIMRIA